MNTSTRMLIGSTLLVLGACASKIPPNIREAPLNAPGISQVRADPGTFIESRIRWGGAILSLDHSADKSRLSIVTFPLNDDGKPVAQGGSAGRFIAEVEGFLEPTIYSKDRDITIIGDLQGIETQRIGGFDYEYPVVAVDEFYLWPKKTVQTGYNRGYYYPYYRPYYPFYPWHFYHFHYHRHKRH